MEISFKSLFDRLIRRWYLMLAFGLLGALAASLVVALGPEIYRAQAVVIVDQQVEIAVPPRSPLDDVLYVSRETVRLEDLTYADSLWEQVIEQIEPSEYGLDLHGIADLRQIVSAPHYQDGNWYFTVEHSDPAFAAALANTWAETFVATVQGWVVTAQEEHAIYAQLEAVSEMKAAAIDTCGQFEWATTRAAEIVETSLGSSDISDEEFTQALASLKQLALGMSIQGASELTFSSIEDLDNARSASRVVLAAMDEEVQSCQAELVNLQGQEDELVDQIEELVQSSFGVSPYLRIQVGQLARDPELVQASPGTTALVGFTVAVALWMMAVITGFFDRLTRSERG